MHPLAIYSLSLGCPKNRVDTERLLGALGTVIPFRAAASIGRADVVLINTCAFIQPAVQESVRAVVDAIKHIARLKKKRPLLVVAGCLVGRYGAATLAQDLSEVDLWLPNQEIDHWPALLTHTLGLSVETQGLGAGTVRLLSTGPSYAWLKISDGCRHKCSFCTIPSIRGPLRSTPADALIEETKALLAQNVREIILVAQDVSAWGADLGIKHGLLHLLERLLPLGMDWLRLMYLYPAGITDDFLRFVREAGPPLLPYFDIPFQHVHPDILQNMGRPFTVDPYRVVGRVRNILPEAALRTSIIVGFPGETHEHFAALGNFVIRTEFTHLGVFVYQPEEGTPAAALPGRVDARELRWRRNRLMEIQADISEHRLATFVGARLPVLVDAVHPEWPGLHTGRVWFQAPEVDGITYISGPDATSGVRPGALITADIVEHSTYDLTALA